MNQRRHLALIAACATFLGTAPMVLVFHEWTWAIDAALVIAGVFLAAMGARALRAPLFLQTVAGVVGFGVVVTLLHSGGTAFLGMIPTFATFHHFNALLSSAGSDIHRLGIPVDDTPGLLFLATIGIGLCAVFNDTVVVGMRRPALAGLPMLAIYAVPVAIDASSVSFLPFAVAAIGYMWLLVTDNLDRVRLFGRRFTGEGRGVDAWEPSPLAAVGRRIAGIGVVLAVLLPFIIPGFTSGLIGVIGNGNGNGSGNCHGDNCAGTVNLLLNLSQNLTQSQSVEMVDVQNSDSSPGYLRLAVATQFTSNGVSAVAPTGPSVGDPLPSVDTSPDGTRLDTNFSSPEHATITLVNQQQNLLPIFLLPTKIDNVSDDWSYDPSADVLFSNSKQGTRGMQYSVDYVKLEPTPEQLRAAQPLDPQDPLYVSMTQLPIQDIPQVDQVLQRTKAGDEFDTVLNIYDYFSVANGFTYSTNVKPDTTGTAIGNFLKNKTGYCVQYAAAMTWLVRKAGYPARVAIGYNQGTQDPAKGTWVLTNHNLHAWTEVYFAGVGWVPFDATPAGGSPIYSQYAPNPNNATPTPGPTASVPSGLASSGSTGRGKQPVDPTGPSGQFGPSGGRGDSGVTWWVLGSLAVLLAVASSPLLVRMAQRRRRVAMAVSHPSGVGEPFLVDDAGGMITAARVRSHTAWDEFIDTLVDYQVPMDASESPYATSNRVATSLYLSHDVAKQVRGLGLAEQRARYAPRPDDPGDLAGAIRSIRRSLSARVSTGTRIRAILLPPSVMIRWRAAVNAWVVTTTARWQVFRESVNRVVAAPRRLLTGRAGR